MKTPTIILLLAVILASCAPVSTETPVPTVTFTPILSTPVSTSTFTPIPVTASPLPTQPTIAVITPELAQLERWKEYENALAMALFPSSSTSPNSGKFLCEWEILGQSDYEVYVWAVCTSAFPVGNSGLFYNGEMPAVIHLGTDGAVQSVETPGAGAHYARDIRKMFPSDVQERIFSNLIDYRRLSGHLRWRREHPEEPPLIVLSATPIP